MQCEMRPSSEQNVELAHLKLTGLEFTSLVKLWPPMIGRHFAPNLPSDFPFSRSRLASYPDG